MSCVFCTFRCREGGAIGPSLNPPVIARRLLLNCIGHALCDTFNMSAFYTGSGVAGICCEEGQS